MFHQITFEMCFKPLGFTLWFKCPTLTYNSLTSWNLIYYHTVNFTCVRTSIFCVRQCVEEVLACQFHGLPQDYPTGCCC